MTMLSAPDTSTSQQRDVVRLRLLKRHSERGTLGHNPMSEDITELLEAFEAPDLPTLVERLRGIIAKFNEAVEPGIQLATMAGLNIADRRIITPDQSFGWRMYYAARALKKRLDCEGTVEFLWTEGVSKIVALYEDERQT